MPDAYRVHGTPDDKDRITGNAISVADAEACPVKLRPPSSQLPGVSKERRGVPPSGGGQAKVDRLRPGGLFPSCQQ
jgi:hypothetical protein